MSLAVGRKAPAARKEHCEIRKRTVGVTQRSDDTVRSENIPLVPRNVLIPAEGRISEFHCTVSEGDGFGAISRGTMGSKNE